MSINFYITLAFFVYFSLLLGAGLIVHKKQKKSSDFIIGNRSLNFWVVAISAHASDMSSWLFMAFPMTIFIGGMSHIWIAFGLLSGMFLNWHFVAPKLRTMTEQYGCYTLSSFFEKRFKDTSGFIRLTSALVMMIFLTHYLSAGLIAMGDLLESLFGLNYLFGLSLALFVIVIYTFLGGFNTIAWIDLFQGVFLLFVISIVPYIAFSKIMSWNAVIETAHQKKISLSILPTEFKTWVESLNLAFGWGLGYFGMPHVITKFMGIKNVSEFKKSKWLGISWQGFALSASLAVGLLGIAYFPQGLANPELVFVEIIKDLFHPFIAGFILCAILAANLSTMDSQILVCSSILGEDLYKHFCKTPPSDKKVLYVSKLGVIIVAFVALLLASKRSATIANTVSYSWSGLGSAFGPFVLVSLYSTKVNKFGAIAGIVSGAVTVMVWPSIQGWMTNYSLMPMIPGFVCSMVSIYIVSWLTSKKNKSPLSHLEKKEK